MKTNNYNDYRIKSLENDSKTSKALAAISGATATLATAVTIGNLTIGNDLIALQNLGTTVAMAGYVIGYLNKARLNNKEVTRLEETKDKPDRPEDRITELKNTITQTKNSLAMSTTAAVGFGISTMANIGLLGDGYYSAVGAMLITGTLSVLDVLLSFQHAKKSKETKARVSLLEDLDEASKKQIPELIESKEDEKRLLK
jgi:hypothetical protein